MPAFETTVTLPDQRPIHVNYRIFGDQASDAPIGAVFANGLGCSPQTTELPAEALAEKGFTVVTFEPDTTARLATEDRVHIMAAIGSNVLGDFVAMGFSLGGDVASRVAFRDYESRAFEVAGLVDAAGSHEASDRFMTGQMARLPERIFADPEGLALPVFLDVLASSGRQSIRDHGAHIAKMSVAELRALHFGACESLREAAAGGSLDQLLLYHGGPSYYIHGDGERATYLPDIEWQEHIRIREIPNSGHFTHADAPEAYVGALAEALIEVNGR